MSATLLRIDVISEGVHGVAVAIIPLQRDLNINAVLIAVHEDRCGVYNRLILIDELNELADSPTVLECAVLAGPLIIQCNLHAGV